MCFVIMDDAIISLRCQIDIFLRWSDTFANDCIQYRQQKNTKKFTHHTFHKYNCCPQHRYKLHEPNLCNCDTVAKSRSRVRERVGGNNAKPLLFFCLLQLTWFENISFGFFFLIYIACFSSNLYFSGVEVTTAEWRLRKFLFFNCGWAFGKGRIA